MVISDSATALRQHLEEHLRASPMLWETLGRLATLHLPNWYLGAGCVAQTVWNLKLGRPASKGIQDYDLVYFDLDASECSEARVRDKAAAIVGDLNIVLDVNNQARVHTWYRDKFGFGIRPYESTRDAIDTWPTTASAVGVRPDGEGLHVYAPFGLQDLFALVVRPNRVQITPGVYRDKVRRWSAEWPSLRILPWDRGVGEENARAI